MLSLGSKHRYYLHREAVDMRKGFDGLSGLVVSSMGGDPLSGDVFIFINRQRNRMKLLVWESGGFVLWYKRLESGSFEVPIAAEGSTTVGISWQKLVLILEGISLQSVVKRKRYLGPGKGKKDIEKNTQKVA